MHEHPNQCHFTTPPPTMGQNPPVPAGKHAEFSPDEKNQDFQGLAASCLSLDSCVEAASESVNAARAELTAALTGPDHGWADLAARAYKQASLLHAEARQQRYELRLVTVGTPEWSAADQELLVALQEAEKRGMLVDDDGVPTTAAKMMDSLDQWHDEAHAVFLPSAPRILPPSIPMQSFGAKSKMIEAH